MTIALPILTFAAGGWLALAARALIADRARQRVNDAAVAALAPEQLARLRAYIAEIDEHERARVLPLRPPSPQRSSRG